MVCLYTSGSFLEPPSMVVCTLPTISIAMMSQWSDIQNLCGLPYNTRTSQLLHMKTVNTLTSCHKDAPFIRHKTLWGLARMNYATIGSNALLLIYVTFKWKCLQVQQRRYFLAYLTINMIWLFWRLQETLHWETRWRSGTAYLCVGTNYLRYMTEAGLLYMFASTTLHRLLAVTKPLEWHTRSKPLLIDVAAIIIGQLIGFIVSTLNFIALLLMNNPDVLKFCKITDTTHEDLSFLLIVKVVNATLVFFLPCTIILVSNVIMCMYHRLVLLRSESVSVLRKAAFRWRFTFLSSLITACLFPEPVSELQLAVYYFQHGGIVRKGAKEVGDAILWSLSTVAIMMTTLAGIRFSPRRIRQKPSKVKVMEKKPIHRVYSFDADGDGEEVKHPTATTSRE